MQRAAIAHRVSVAVRCPRALARILAIGLVATGLTSASGDLRAGVSAASDNGDVAPVSGGGRVALGATYPTAHEQYLVELINRARANPAAEAALYGIDLNEGVPPGETISTDPKQPLAINLNLTDAAQLHSQWMIDNDTFSHWEGAVGPGDRMAAAGYAFVPGWGWGENLAISMMWPDVPEPTAGTQGLHEALFVDENYPDRGHRTGMMRAALKEVGAGVRSGVYTDSAPPYYDWNAIDCTTDFAYSNYLGGNHFITGVAYDDTLVAADSFYTPGEALAGLTITATHQSTMTVYTTTTWASGGYWLSVPPGTYTVVGTGGGLGGVVTYTGVVVGAENVKRDFTPDAVPPTLTISLSLSDSWVYPNTPVTTGGTAQHATVTVSITGGTEVAGEQYQVTFGQGAPAPAPVTDFQITQPVAWAVDQTTGDVAVAGGLVGSSTPGTYTLHVTVTGLGQGQVATATMGLKLRLYGDVNDDAVVDTADKLEINRWLNGIATAATFRELDLTGDGAAVDTSDKLQINRILNGIAVP